MPSGDHTARPSAVFAAFFIVGGTVYGGMWAATQKLERELVEKRQWLTKEELQAQLLVSALIPAPQFLSLSGLVGFHVASWRGLVSAIAGAMLPKATLIVSGLALLRPELVEGPLSPLGTTIGVAVVGLLAGNAYGQLRQSRGRLRTRLLGYGISAGIFVAIVTGVPLILAAVAAFVVCPAVINRSESGVRRNAVNG